MRNYEVLSENKYLLDPNKTTSLLLQSIENTIKGTVQGSQYYKAANLLPRTNEKIGKKMSSSSYHESFLDRFMRNTPAVIERKFIRISCGIISVGGKK